MAMSLSCTEDIKDRKLSRNMGMSTMIATNNYTYRKYSHLHISNVRSDLSLYNLRLTKNNRTRISKYTELKCRQCYSTVYKDMIQDWVGNTPICPLCGCDTLAIEQERNVEQRRRK